jgi:hypothetical protein
MQCKEVRLTVMVGKCTGTSVMETQDIAKEHGGGITHCTAHGLHSSKGPLSQVGLGQYNSTRLLQLGDLQVDAGTRNTCDVVPRFHRQAAKRKRKHLRA